MPDDPTHGRFDVSTAERRSGLGTLESEVPDFRAARRHVIVELLRLIARLRDSGVGVPADGALAAARALAHVGLGDEAAVDAALRATLVATADDLAAFDEAFPTFWHRLRTGLDAVGTDHDGPAADDGAGDGERDDTTADVDEAGLLADAESPSLDGEAGGDLEVRLPTERRRATGDRAVAAGTNDARRYSATGGSERVDIEPARLTDRETAAVDRFVDAVATRPGRRRVPASGDRFDARRALRASVATGGAPVDLPTVAPAQTELRCCLLVDVSGSVLDTVERDVLLAVAARLVGRARDARVFLFDTDLVDATPQFAAPGGDPAAALHDAEIEWGGGTRIGAALATLRRDHPTAVDRRTVVLVVSDGLDVGEQEVLAEGVTWLADRAASVVWLNPLAVSPAFEPTARGMATARPYLDALFGFADPADLAAAARQLERRGLDGRVGYEHDPRRFEEGGVP